MCMMTRPLNNKFIKILLDCQSVARFKVTMRQFLHMDKLVQEKPILCKVLDTTCMTMKEVLYPEQSKISSDTFNHAKTKM